MPEFTSTIEKIITEKGKLYDLKELLSSVKLMQRESFKDAIDFYIREKALTENLSFDKRGSVAATAVNQWEKRLSKALTTNKTYNEEIKNYIRSFDSIEKLNEKLHRSLNNLDISGIEKLAARQKKELVGNIAKGITGEIHVNLQGEELRRQFTKPVKRLIYENVLLGTSETETRKILKDYILGNKERLGQLERWAGQITRDSLSQYDGFINDMVRKKYDLNAIRYVGSLIKTSRAQCIRWVRKKGGILKISELQKEIKWAYSNGNGMIPGTTPENFSRYRGGWACRHEAIPFYLSKEEDRF